MASSASGLACFILRRQRRRERTSANELTRRSGRAYVENTGHKTNWTWQQFKEKLAAYRGGGEEDEMISQVFKERRIAKGYNQHQYRTVTADTLNVRLAPDPNAPKHPYWGKLSKGNAVQEVGRFDNGWSCVYIVAGKGTGTIGYVNSAYLK